MGSLIEPSPCESCEHGQPCTLYVRSCNKWSVWFSNSWAEIRAFYLGIEKPERRERVKRIWLTGSETR